MNQADMIVLAALVMMWLIGKAMNNNSNSHYKNKKNVNKFKS